MPLPSYFLEPIRTKGGDAPDDVIWCGDAHRDFCFRRPDEVHRHDGRDRDRAVFAGFGLSGFRVERRDVNLTPQARSSLGEHLCADVAAVPVWGYGLMRNRAENYVFLSHGTNSREPMSVSEAPEVK